MKRRVIRRKLATAISALLLSGCIALTEGASKYTTVVLVDPTDRTLLEGAPCRIMISATQWVRVESGRSLMLPRQYKPMWAECTADGHRGGRYIHPIPNNGQWVPGLNIIDALAGTAVEPPDTVVVVLDREIMEKPSLALAQCEGMRPSPRDTLACLNL